MANWQLSDDPYHTDFVSWHVDHFSFFEFFPLIGVGGWGLDLDGKFHYFFNNLSVRSFAAIIVKRALDSSK